MVDLSGKFQMDGQDIWTAFNMFVEEGSADFLRYAPRKDSITHDWKDSNGIDVDVTRHFFTEKQVTLNMAIIADSEEQFWLKHDSFIATFLQPGLRRLSFASHGLRSYHVFYKDSGAYTQVLPLKGDDETVFGPNKVAAKFSLTIVEPNPKINNSLVAIADESGRILTT